MQDLTVALVQEALVWEAPEENRQQLGRVLESLAPADLVVLPEMFTTGFSTASMLAAEPMDGPTLAWMREQARAGGFALTGSVKIVEDGGYFNRMIWVDAAGRLEVYDKRHLFRLAGEHERYRAGVRRVIVPYRGWRILLQVCYDLRFPVFSRNRDDYDVIIYVANWPTPRRVAWTSLLPARAIENLCYCIGVNRVGQDGNGREYSGDSVAVDFKGEYLAHLGSRAGSATAVLSASALSAFRSRFPAQQDADDFGLL